MALAYLFDPCKQWQNRAGVNNVSGYIEVFIINTDTHATVYTDFTASAVQPAHIGIDNDGRAVMVVDADKVYRVEMHDPSGNLIFTQQPVYPVKGSSGQVVNNFEVVSTDGSINVEPSTSGNTKTFDISIPEDGNDLLEWIRCDGGEHLSDTDTYRPQYTDGTMEVGEIGVKLQDGQLYHATVHIRATKNETRQPFDDKVDVLFKLYNGTEFVNVTRQSVIVDYSTATVQDFEVSTDVKAPSDCELAIDILSQDIQGGDFELLNLEVHRVYSGCPSIPSGVLSRVQAQEMIDAHGKGVHRLLRYYTNAGDSDPDHPTGDWLHDLDAVDESDPSGHPMVTADQLFDWYEDGQIFDLYEIDGRNGQIGWSAIYRMVTWQDQSDWWSQFAPVPGKACRLEFFRMGMYSTPYRGGLIAYIRYKDEPYMRLYEIKSGNSIWMAEYQEKLPYYDSAWHNGDFLKVKQDGSGLEWVTVHEPVIGTIDL